MSLKMRLNEELNRLTASGGLGSAPASVALEVEGGRLECTLVAVDQLACAFEQLAYRAPALDQASMAQLNRMAEMLSKRLSYLLETISPIETDSEGCVVQMRSNPPHQDDDGMSYYELVVRRGEVSLCRYSKSSGQMRRLIPAHVTREVFYRLAQDLSSAKT